MADSPTIKPLALSEQDYVSKALPDQSPGDVSDAESNVFPDANLQSTDDWQRAAEQIESGSLDAQIAAEEASLAPQPAQQAGVPAPAPVQQPPEGPIPADLRSAEEDMGSQPLEIGMTPDVQANPVTGQAPAEFKQEPVPTELAAPASDPAQQQPAAPAPPAETGEATAPQHRVRGIDQTEQLALEIRRESIQKNQADPSQPVVTLKDAIELSENRLGTGDQQQQSQPQGFEIPEGMPATVEEITKAIRDIEMQEVDAGEEMEFDTLRELKARKFELQDFQPKLVSYQNQQENIYRTSFKESGDQVVNLYPMAKDENGEFARAMGELDSSLQASGDDRFHDPNKPLILAREVAKRLNIFPVAPATQPTPQTEPAPVAQQQQSAPQTSQRKYQAAPPVPASGTARTGGASPNHLDDQIANLSEDQYLGLKESWGN